MTADWTRELFNQFDLQWNLAHGPSLETLTDEEYLWEPVPGCWSIRPTGPGGRGEFEQASPDPEPAPVTTIAWRISHLAVGVFGLRASHYFGDGSLTHENTERPLTAKEGVAYFKEQALQWRSRIERLDEEGLARPVGEPEHAPMVSLVLHVNREALHHLAEVSLLRDLYRATGGGGSPDAAMAVRATQRIAPPGATSMSAPPTAGADWRKLDIRRRDDVTALAWTPDPTSSSMPAYRHAATPHAGICQVAGTDAISRYELGLLIEARDGLDQAALAVGLRAATGRVGALDVRLDSSKTQAQPTTRLRGGASSSAPGGPDLPTAGSGSLLSLRPSDPRASH